MRFGAPIFQNYGSGEEWAKIHAESGYNAAYSPINSKEDLKKKDEFLDACKKYNIIISEMGAWSNPMSPDKEQAKAAFDNCVEKLYIADQIGARCCVNISGNAGAGSWDTHSKENLEKETFDKVVEVTQKIIDSVNPVNTYYTLEMMPWMYPYDETSYLELIKAINREHFAVHIDIVNVINNPLKYYTTDKIIKETFALLGKYIKSIHVKDIRMAPEMTVHLNEIVLGKGNFNLQCLVDEVKKLNPEIPMMLEHLATKEDYVCAGAYFKSLF